MHWKKHLDEDGMPGVPGMLPRACNLANKNALKLSDTCMLGWPVVLHLDVILTK